MMIYISLPSTEIFMEFSMFPSLNDEEKKYPFYKRIILLFSRSARFYKLTSGVELLMLVPIFLGFLILIGGDWLRKTVFGGNVPNHYEQKLLGFFCLISSLGGIIPIIKKKFPGAFWIYIEGKPAIVLGIIWCLIFLALAIYEFRF